MLANQPYSLLRLIFLSLTAKVIFCQDWRICKDLTNLHAKDFGCPYVCGDFIMDDILCQADGVTPLSCSGSRSCPGNSNCERSVCVKLPCYEPDRSRYSPAFHSFEVCKQRKGKWDWNTPKDDIKPVDIGNKPNSGYGRTARSFSAVLPVLLMLIVIVTAISILSCCMKRRQTRRFQNRQNARQATNEPLMDNARARPNIRVNPGGPVTAGALPPVRPSVPYQAGYFLPPTAPYPTLPYPTGQTSSAANYQPAFSNQPFPKEFNELPPSYSPPKGEPMVLDSSPPPSYFEAVAEDRTRLQTSNR